MDFTNTSVSLVVRFVFTSYKFFIIYYILLSIFAILRIFWNVLPDTSDSFLFLSIESQSNRFNFQSQKKKITVDFPTLWFIASFLTPLATMSVPEVSLVTVTALQLHGGPRGCTADGGTIR